MEGDVLDESELENGSALITHTERMRHTNPMKNQTFARCQRSRMPPAFSEIADDWKDTNKFLFICQLINKIKPRLGTDGAIHKNKNQAAGLISSARLLGVREGEF